MKTKEKDANVIHNLFTEYHYADDLGVIKSKLAQYVTTIRQEERRAAFRDIRDLIATVNPRLTFGAANGSVMKQSILGTVDTFIACNDALIAIEECPCVEFSAATPAPVEQSIDPIGDFVEKVWELTNDRDGWSRITLRGLVESLARQYAIPSPSLAAREAAEGIPKTTYKNKRQLSDKERFRLNSALNDYTFNNCDHEHDGYPNHLICRWCALEIIAAITCSPVPAAGGDEDGQELQKLRQAIGWICDACDAAYIEDPNNERIHELFNIAAQAAGLTRRLPDEHGRFDETSTG